MGLLKLRRRVTQQPQVPLPIDWSNPITRGLRVAYDPAAGPINLVTGAPLRPLAAAGPVLPNARGRHQAFANGGAGNVLVTDFFPGQITEHSAFLLARSSAMSGEAGYISTRNTSAAGFSFAALGVESIGVAPNQTSRLRYTHAGVADYEFNPALDNFGVDFTGIGFSATNGVDVRSFVRGAFKQAANTGTMYLTDNPIIIGGDPTYGAGAQADMMLVLYWDRRLSDAEHASLAENPHQIRRAPSRMIAVGSAPIADMSLSGAAAVRVAATGTLSTAIRMVGATVGQVSAAGTLTSQVRLAGAASLTASVAGTMSTSIPLSGAAALQASASGALTTQVRLAGAASMAVTAAGTLAGAGAVLSGTASLQVSAAGSLTTAIPLSGAAALEMSAGGALAGSAVVLAGGASMRIGAAAALSSAIVLSGAAVVRASVSGALAGSSAALSGAATLSMQAAGTLSATANIDVSKISPARIVVFEGSGSRAVPFDGSGSRVVPFEGSGGRTVRFE